MILFCLHFNELFFHAALIFLFSHSEVHFQSGQIPISGKFWWWTKMSGVTVHEVWTWIKIWKPTPCLRPKTMEASTLKHLPDQREDWTEDYYPLAEDTFWFDTPVKSQGGVLRVAHDHNCWIIYKNICFLILSKYLIGVFKYFSLLSLSLKKSLFFFSISRKSHSFKLIQVLE